MDRRTATRLMRNCAMMNDQLDLATLAAHEITDRAERERILKAIGIVIGSIYTGLTYPVVEQYRDLDPEPRKTP